MSHFSQDPPRRLSHFELKDLLGRGGMGAVYRAEDVWSGTAVAIKLLHPHLIDDADFRERFVREAQFASLLTSPYTCKLLEYGEVGTTHFMVMELVEGETVHELLRDGPLPTERALGLARQAALSLEEAEHKGLVHRDIKPDNLKVTPDGRMKVLDFGITRRLKGASLTQTGQFVGTIAYAAPEAFLGSTEIDHRADIYSFGATLFHMLAGERPFSSDAPGRLILDHQQTPPPLEKLAGQPESVVEIVRRCLEKDRDKRYQKFSDLILALEEAQSARPVDEPKRDDRPAPTPAPESVPAEAQAETQHAEPPSTLPRELASDPTRVTPSVSMPRTVSDVDGETVRRETSTARAALSMELRPAGAPGRPGSPYVLTLENRGRSETQVTLVASDQESVCQFTLPAQVTVPAGGRKDVPLRVSPRRRQWFGSRRQHSFEVRASDGGGGEPPTTASGQFEELPFFSGWFGWAAIGGGVSVAGAAAFAVVLILMLGGDGDLQAVAPVPADPAPDDTAEPLPSPRPTRAPPPTLEVPLNQLVTRDLPPEGDSLSISTAMGPVNVERSLGTCIQQGFPTDDENGPSPFARASVSSRQFTVCVVPDEVPALEIADQSLFLFMWLCSENIDDIEERIAFYITRFGDDPPSSLVNENSGDFATCERFVGASAQRR